MKKIILVLLAPILLWNCNSANNQHPSSKYEEKKASVEEMERDSPLKFLKVTASHHGNLINQTVVEGEISNKATLASYKNIELSINFLDKDGSSIDKQKHTINDVIKPGSSNEFKIKISHVKGAESVSVDITGAMADK